MRISKRGLKGVEVRREGKTYWFYLNLKKRIERRNSYYCKPADDAYKNLKKRIESSRDYDVAVAGNRLYGISKRGLKV